MRQRAIGGTLVLLSLATLSGCAHATTQATESTTVTREPAAIDPPPTVVIENAVVAPDSSPRPRLSRTVTLRQGASEPIYATGPVAPQGQSGGPNVTVNNNITVVGQQGYGGYGGYGYGGYGGTRYGTTAGYGRGVTRDGFGTTGTTSRQAWAPTGWEGAQRTAAPGRTPGVGGNWAPAPSFGPAQMK